MLPQLRLQSTGGLVRRAFSAIELFAPTPTHARRPAPARRVLVLVLAPNAMS